jgi:hypothetical protein
LGVEILFLVLRQLYSIKLEHDGADKLCWNPSKKRLFDVKSFYSVLIPHVSNPFPWRCIWMSMAPLRVTFLDWYAAFGSILTMDNLRKRKIMVGWCFMCKKSGETVDNLMLHCVIASALWYSIFYLFGLALVMSRWLRDLLACWRKKIGNSQIEDLWKMIPLCLMWCIWNEINDQRFEDGERTVVELKAFFPYPFLVESHL